MRLIPSVVRGKGPHEAHEVQSGDYAKRRAARENPQKGCDERPNEAGQCCANSQQHYWLEPLDPRQSAGQTLPLATSGECFATSACWSGQVSPGATRPMPTKR